MWAPPPLVVRTQSFPAAQVKVVVGPMPVQVVELQAAVWTFQVPPEQSANVRPAPPQSS